MFNCFSSWLYKSIFHPFLPGKSVTKVLARAKSARRISSWTGAGNNGFRGGEYKLLEPLIPPPSTLFSADLSINGERKGAWCRCPNPLKSKTSPE